MLGTCVGSCVQTSTCVASASTRSFSIIPALTKMFQNFPSERVPEIRLIASPAFTPNIPRPGLPYRETPLLKMKPRWESWGALEPAQQDQFLSPSLSRFVPSTQRSLPGSLPWRPGRLPSTKGRPLGDSARGLHGWLGTGRSACSSPAWLLDLRAQVLLGWLPHLHTFTSPSG